jgi:hypothetical protein
MSAGTEQVGEGKMEKLTKPFIFELDMGLFKPLKYAIWFPYPIFQGKTGRNYHIHPKRLYKTRITAEKALAKYEMKNRPQIT